MTAHVHQSTVVSGRGLVFIGLIAAHLAALTAVMQQRLAHAPIAEPPAIRVIDPTVQPPPQESPAPRQQNEGLTQVRPPDVPLPQPVYPVEEPQLITLSQPDPQPGPTAGAPAVPSLTAMSFVQLRSPDDFYPSSAIRLGETGAVHVELCVGPDGALAHAPQVLRSSGSPRLDAAAVRWGSEALRFQPAIRDGVAVAGCKSVRVLFGLR